METSTNKSMSVDDHMTENQINNQMDDVESSMPVVQGFKEISAESLLIVSAKPASFKSKLSVSSNPSSGSNNPAVTGVKPLLMMKSQRNNNNQLRQSFQANENPSSASFKQQLPPKLPLTRNSSTEKMLVTSKAKLSPRKGSVSNEETNETIDQQETNVSNVKKNLLSLTNTSRIFRYKIFPGNNSRVIMMAMKKRPWWHAILNNTNNNHSSSDNSSTTSSLYSSFPSNGSSKTTTRDQENLSNEDLLLQFQPSFIWEMYKNSKRYKNNQYKSILINHIQRNQCLVTKKGLYFSLKQYCLQQNLAMSSMIPLTWFLSTNEEDQSNDETTVFSSFCQEEKDRQGVSSVDELIFIMKPASHTNRGFGIKVVKGLHNVLKIVHKKIMKTQQQQSQPSSKAMAKATKKPSSSAKTTSSAKNTKKMTSNKPLNDKQKPTNQEELAEVDEEEACEPCQPEEGDEEGDEEILEEDEEIDEEDDEGEETTRKPHKESTNTPVSSQQIAVETNKRLSQMANKIARQGGYIVQQYIAQPALIQGRKFDIRCYVLVRVLNYTEFTAFFYQDAYIRTSSKKFSLANIQDKEAHLTNDAVQKFSSSYGKYENNNKLSLEDWQEYISSTYASDESVSREPLPCDVNSIVSSFVFPEIKRLTKQSIEAVKDDFLKTNQKNSFEMFGYDYMILNNFQPVLIEVNTNPCLEFVNDLLTNIVTNVIEDTIRLTVDQIFPPPPKNQRTKATEEAIREIEGEPNRFEPLYP